MAELNATSACVLLTWLAAVEVLVVATWFVPFFTLQVVALAAAAATGAVSILAMRRSAACPACWRGFLLAVAITVFCALLGAVTHDSSYDGQTYHQQAILALERGWNPLLSPTYPGPHSLWVSHYSKGPWLVSAALFAATGNVEIGKGISWLLMYCAGSLVHAAVLNWRPDARRLALAAAALAALNPVACYQVQTYYVDGQVASLLTAFVALSYLTLRQPTKVFSTGLGAAWVVGAGIKFSVLPFLAIIFVSAVLVNRVAGDRVALSRLGQAALPGLVVALMVNWHPLVTNAIAKGHPFYPLAGPGAVDILTGHAGTSFLNQNRFEKFARSVFSASQSQTVSALTPSDEQFRLKIPFTIKAGELASFYRYTDIRVGGFGPLAGGLLLLALAASLMAARRAAKSRTDIAAMSLFAGLAASVAVMPEFWWARYAPQMWLLLIAPAIAILGAIEGRGLRWLAATALVAAAVNVTLVLGAALANRAMTELDYRAQIESLVQISSQAGPLRATLQEESTRHRLTDSGVRFADSESMACDGVVATLIATTSQLCVPHSMSAIYRRGSPTMARLLGRSL
jgi:hypothetical protein